MRLSHLVMTVSLVLCAGCAPVKDANTQAAEDTKAKAEAGDPAAERELGQMYLWGRGVGFDPVEGVRWFQKAIAAGDPQALKLLSDDYEKRFGAPVGGPAKGHALRMQLAQMGVVGAERDVGQDFLRGQGTDVDYAQALAWSQKASDEGDALAPANVGYIYVEGLGVPEDDARSIDAYKLSAQRGYRPAQLFLGLIYRLGMYGAPKDQAKADQYYAMAAQGEMKEDMPEVMNQIIDGHKVYPRDAAAAKQGGVVTVEFDCPARRPEHVRVTKSSGFPLLDAAAAQAVSDSTFPEHDPSLFNGVHHFTIKVNFDPTATHLPIGP